ncbi:hypothetical protein [Flectobacillus major]|jgi:uncharacterized coiled-coil protein SlyX|uniref:hypothetical protein n=1 Tax=Flectobacillus major TaxID=103 RepID=UPI0006933177|nr:hypothetical protein [Flectobacillus major]
MRPKISKKAPGERLVKRMPLRTKWILCAAAGLLLFGFGISIVSVAGYKKGSGEAFYIWFLMGLYGLIMSSLGLVSFGQAIRFKVLMDINKKFNKQEKELAKQIRKLNHLGEVLRNKEDKKAKLPEKKTKEKPKDGQKENLATTDEV